MTDISTLTIDSTEVPVMARLSTLDRFRPVWIIVATAAGLLAGQADLIIDRPWDVTRIALPLVIYVLLTFGTAFALGYALTMSCARTTTLAFTAAGNNFELAIAVAIGTFCVTSGQTLAGVVGPLIEVPALVALVYVALWLRRRFPTDTTQPTTPVVVTPRST